MFSLEVFAPTAAAKAIVADEAVGWQIEKSAIDSSPSEHRLVSVISYQFITPDMFEDGSVTFPPIDE